MQKADLIKNVSKKIGVDKKTTTIVVNAFLEEIVNSLKQGINVSIREFASFEIKIQNPKRYPNINTGKMELSKKYYYLKFTPSTLIKNFLKKKTVY